MKIEFRVIKKYEEYFSLYTSVPIRYIFISLIKIYQFLTPWMNCCRFHPSCSRYSEEALKKYGLIVGLILTVYRLLRCHPLCKCGEDPVPSHIKFGFKRERVGNCKCSKA